MERRSVRTAETVFLVDDDASVLRATARLLRSAGWQTATFSSPQDFLAQQDPEASGCLVLDVSMPGLNGMDLHDALRAGGNRLPVIFLTGNGDIPMSVRAMKKGAVDFLSKPCRDDELIAAVRAALERDAGFRKQETGRKALAARIATLTAREHEVMLGVAAGEPNKVIAARLGIVEKTVKVHRARVMEKLRVASVAELVRLLANAGIKHSPE